MVLGWTPSDIDRCTFRDVWYALGGALERKKLARREAWERTCAVLDAVANLGGAAQQIGTTFRQMFDVEEPEATYDQVVQTLKPLTLPRDGEHL